MSQSKSTPEITEQTWLLSRDSPEKSRPKIVVQTPSDDEYAYADDQPPAEYLPGSNRSDDEESLPDESPAVKVNLWYLIPAVSLGIFMAAADQTLVFTSYSRIGSDLRSLENTSWVATSYFLTLTSFQPLYGRLSDIFGRRPMLLFAYSVFGIGSIFCGLARNMGELIAARAFAGIGAGGMTTVVSILLSDVVPLRKRASFQSYMNLFYAAGASAGAPLGGLCVDTIGWRWAFIVQGPLCLIAILMVYFVFYPPPVEDIRWKEKLARVDFLGALSLILAVVVLLIGLDRGSNVAWSDVATITCCALALPLFAVFVFVELKVAHHPFAPVHVIFNRSILAAYLTNLFCMSAQMATVFYIPLYFQVVNNLSATESGVRLIPPLFCSVAGAIVTGQIIDRTGRYYWWSIIALCVSVIGATIVSLSSSVFKFSWGLIIGGCCIAFGTGSTITTTLMSVISNVEPEDVAIATACTYLFRSLGSVIGISLGSTVVQQTLRTELLSKLSFTGKAEEAVERVRQSLDFIKDLEPDIKNIVVGCYARATTGAFGLSGGLLFLALLSAFFIKEKRLSK